MEEPAGQGLEPHAGSQTWPCSRAPSPVPLEGGKCASPSFPSQPQCPSVTQRRGVSGYCPQAVVDWVLRQLKCSSSPFLEAESRRSRV